MTSLSADSALGSLWESVSPWVMGRVIEVMMLDTVMTSSIKVRVMAKMTTAMVVVWFGFCLRPEHSVAGCRLQAAWEFTAVLLPELL